MKANKGLTRVDAIIALACVALVLAQAGVINAGGRERSKREVCLANLRSLAAAWQTYSNDNNGKIPVGDVYYSWVFPLPPFTPSGAVSPIPPGPQLAWCEWPHRLHPAIPRPTYTTNYSGAYTFAEAPGLSDEIWNHAIAEGTLWKYVGDYNIYRCPVGDKGQRVTYLMSHAMATYPNSGGSTTIVAPQIALINQIRRPAERFVFLDNGRFMQGAFFVEYSGSNVARWYDLPPMCHSQGTTFAFADGHAIYRKWTDLSALAQAKAGIWGGGPDDNCDCDLRWMTKITWGDVPYSCSNPNKHCEY
jgi:prepilin-type processing-associated H-X9-DG protein